MTVKTCPPDHRHAANFTCAKAHGCSCTSCRALCTKYQAWLRRRKDAGLPSREYVPRLGTQRRVRALSVLGYSIAAIGAGAGVAPEQIRGYLHTENDQPIGAKAAAAIAAFYRIKSFAQHPKLTNHTSRVINRARSAGWHPPIAWHDIDNDLQPDIEEKEAA